MRVLAAALLMLVAQAASAQAPSLYGMPFSSDPTCSAGTYWLAVNTTVGGWRICFNGSLSTMGSGGSGEVNTHSSVGGGLALTAATPKVGVDLRLVSLASADFDLSGDLVTIDATKWITIAAANAAYQPIDSDLTALAGLAGVQGDVIYRNATQWTRLAAGTAGQVLHTQGAGANPTWDTDDTGGGGGNALEQDVTCTANAGWCSATVTGQAWVTASSKIICQPFGSDLAAAAMLDPVALNRVAGVGFDIAIANPENASGTIPVHCVGV